MQTRVRMWSKNAKNANMICESSHTQSPDRTLFYSNLFGHNPRGARGVKRTGRAQGSIPWCVFALIFSPNWTNFEKPHRIKKIYQKWLFSDSFSKFVQFELNISTNHIKILILWSFLFFWHPWHSYGHIHSEDIIGFVFVFDIFEW